MITATRQRLRYVIGDFLTTSLAWLVFNVIRYIDIVVPSGLHFNSLGSFLMIKPVILGQILIPTMMLGLYWLSGYYNQVFFKSRLQELLNTLGTAAVGTILIFFIAIIDDPIPDRISNYQLLLMLFLLMAGFVYALRVVLTSVTTSQIRNGKWKLNALIIGKASHARSLYKRLTSNKNRQIYDIRGIIATEEARVDKMPVETMPFSELRKAVADNGIKHLIIAGDYTDLQETLDLVNRLYRFGLPVMVETRMFPLLGARNRLNDIAGEPLVDITAPAMSHFTRNLKRVSDIAVSAIGLVALSPLYAALALAVKLDSKGPVFYRQERIGYHRKPFKIVKFRTMRTDAEQNGPALSSASDNRITRVGHFLRKYRLDEFPQFWNVLKGDMSIVGPRPEREFFINKILERAPYYTLIHQVRPGITSWGMVKHGYASNVDEMVKRLHYDLLYIENVSLQVDLKILFYTVDTVITGKGI